MSPGGGFTCRAGPFLGQTNVPPDTPSLQIMPSAGENFLDERQLLVKKLRLRLVILSLEGASEWEGAFLSTHSLLQSLHYCYLAERNGSYNTLLWTFSSDLGDDDFPEIRTSKIDWCSGDPVESENLNYQEIPVIGDWSLACLQTLRRSLQDGRVSVKLSFSRQHSFPLKLKSNERDADYQDSTMASTVPPKNRQRDRRVRTHNRVKSRLASTIEAATGRQIQELSLFNPLVSNPDAPYFFQWQFSDQYPAFPKVTGGISRWNSEQFKACEEALDGGHLSVVDTRPGPPQPISSRPNIIQASPLTARPWTSKAINSPIAQMQARPTGDVQPSQPCHTMLDDGLLNSSARIYTNIVAARTNAPSVAEPDRTPSATPRRAIDFSASKVHLEQAFATAQNEAKLAMELDTLRIQLQESNRRLTSLRNERDDAARKESEAIANAKSDGEAIGRSKAIQDMTNAHDEALIALTRVHREQLEKVRKESYEEGLESAASKHDSKLSHIMSQLKAANEDLATCLETTNGKHSEDIQHAYDEGLRVGSQHISQLTASNNDLSARLEELQGKHGQDVKDAYEDGFRVGNERVSQLTSASSNLMARLEKLKEGKEPELMRSYNDGFREGKESASHLRRANNDLSSQLGQLQGKYGEEIKKAYQDGLRNGGETSRAQHAQALASMEEEKAMQLKELEQKYTELLETAKDEGRMSAYKELAIPVEERLDPQRLNSIRKVRELKTIFQNWGQIPQEALPLEMLPEGHTPGDKTLYLLAKLNKDIGCTKARNLLKSEIEKRNSSFANDAHNYILTNSDIRKVLESIGVAANDNVENAAASSSQETSVSCTASPPPEQTSLLPHVESTGLSNLSTEDVTDTPVAPACVSAASTLKDPVTRQGSVQARKPPTEQNSFRSERIAEKMTDGQSLRLTAPQPVVELGRPAIQPPTSVKAFTYSFMQEHFGYVGETFTVIDREQAKIVSWAEILVIDTGEQEAGPKLGQNGTTTFMAGGLYSNRVGNIYPTVLKTDNGYQYIGHYKVTNQDDVHVTGWKTWPLLKRERIAAEIDKTPWCMELLQRSGLSIDPVAEQRTGGRKHDINRFFDATGNTASRMTRIELQLYRFNHSHYGKLIIASAGPRNRVPNAPTGPSRIQPKRKSVPDNLQRPPSPKRHKPEQEGYPKVRSDLVGYSQKPAMPTTKEAAVSTTAATSENNTKETPTKQGSRPGPSLHQTPHQISHQTIQTETYSLSPKAKSILQLWTSAKAKSWLSRRDHSQSMLAAVRTLANTNSFEEIVPYINCEIIRRCRALVPKGGILRRFPTTADFISVRNRRQKLFPITLDDLAKHHLRYGTEGLLEHDDGKASSAAHHSAFTNLLGIYNLI
ncbi:hypothetical protein B0J14DRAFT_605109 [Halenospora varia]|nr:hypothetical protein B0J14DRAFT_605109 [Halenospora varia]